MHGASMTTTPSTNASEMPDSDRELPHGQPAEQEDDVIRIEDLAPRENVKGGRKILLGEIPTPPSNPRKRPAS